MRPTSEVCSLAFTRLTLVALSAAGVNFTPYAALAQKSGSLLHRADSANAVHALVAGGSAAEEARRDTIFAALVVDPSLTALARSSAWTASVVPAGAVKEARVQANLCDVASALCAGGGASSVTVAGPLNTGDDFTELADLHGLVGSARVEANYSSNIAKTGSFMSFTGTFASPGYSYRDTAMRWEQSYRPQTSQNVCTPADFGPAGTTACANMVIGAPSSVTRAVASLSAAWSIGGNAAMRLTVSQDLRNAITGVDLPVWIITNAAGGLAGGVRFGYRTDARQATVALFVSEFKL
jgi:hypothetical protein